MKEIRANEGYPFRQLAKAFLTAVTHEDAATRERAEQRISRWRQVLEGMATGRLHIGSRTPVAGLPSWVTPEVVHGGFATGEPAAGGELQPYERELAERAGIPADRGALFAYYLTEQGLSELGTMLSTGTYDVTVPEEAALLVVAWLVRAEDPTAALALADELAPFSGRLRFAPRPATAPASDASIVYRETAGQVKTAVARRQPNERIEAMREALTIWNPFADKLLAHWLETVVGGQVAGEARMTDGWRERGRALLRRYAELASTHTCCTKHRNPKANLAILRTALEAVEAGRPLEPRQRGLLQHAVDSMVRRRGKPGSQQHKAIRDVQAAEAARPSYHTLAQVVVRRLSGVPQNTGVESVAAIMQPVTAQEGHAAGIPPGVEIPPPIRHVVERATAGTVEQLIAGGIVPSAEVLTTLVPQIAAAAMSTVYSDEALQTLMAATYRAFRKCRSLLLLNLEHQVRVDELPWVRAAQPYRVRKGAAQEGSRAALCRMSELVGQAFPGTILPNPMIRELDALARAAGLDVPFVEELAADIFMGTFSSTFLRAAKLAAEVVGDTVYKRYYGIDYNAVLAIDDGPANRGRRAARTSAAFDMLCAYRAGPSAVPTGWYSVAANGMIIEQAQIVTTHSLATLAGPIGIAPAPGWADLAGRAFEQTRHLMARVHNNPRPLPTIKDAAYAWPQCLFFLSMLDAAEQAEVTDWCEAEAARAPVHAAERLTQVLAGLRHVLAGRSFGPDWRSGTVRRFLGWQAGERHWLLEPAVQR